MHSALQVLVNLPQFFYLLFLLPNRNNLDSTETSTPILDSLKEFVSNFKLYKLDSKIQGLGRSNVKMASEFTFDSAFTLSRSLMSHKIVIQGQQEDVEEFLFSILDSLHEELTAVRNVHSATEANNTSETATDDNPNESINGHEGNGVQEDSGDNWVSMGPKRREKIHREVSSTESIVTQLFGGQFVNEVRKRAQKPSCTTQRFFTLRLDIKDDQILTLNDALVKTFSKEVIEQNDSSEITQLSYLAKLPDILILQLKMFVYNAKENVVEKVNKLITFEDSLEIPASCFGENRSSMHVSQRRYKLFAVIYHHGQDANKGHYSASIFHTGQRMWISYNDAEVRKTEVKNVLKCDIKEKVPYLLIYRKLE